MPDNRKATKAPFGSQIKWGHRLTQNLVYAINFNEFSGAGVLELVNNRILKFNDNTPVWKNNGVYFDGSGGSYIQNSSGPKLSSEFTISLKLPRLTSAGNTLAFFSLGSVGSSDTIIILATNNSDTSILYSFFADDWSITVPSHSNRSSHFIFGFKAGNKYFYADGVNYGTASSGTFAGNTTIGFGLRNDNTGPLACAYEQCLIWDRLLQQDEIHSLFQDSYQLFKQPLSSPVFFINSNLTLAISENLNHPWADAVTENLASPFLTLSLTENLNSPWLDATSNDFTFLTRSLSETLSFSDNLKIDIGLKFSETFTFSDSSIYNITLLFQENINSWAEGFSVAAPLTQSFTETLSFSDSKSLPLDLLLGFKEALSLNDARSTFLTGTLNLSEALTFNDSITAPLAYLLNSTESLSLSDLATVSGLAAVLKLALADSLNNWADATNNLLSTSLISYYRRYLGDVIR